jgi:two-component system chemotaxis response regulator CheB
MTDSREALIPVRVAELLCSRLCHDLISPVAALKNGMELLAVILTGMGHDWLEGCRVAVEAGATLLAPDEASSVVWGMLGAVAGAGLCSEVLPLDQVAGSVLKPCGRSAS